MNKITIKKPIDFHLHLREGKLLHDLAKESSSKFGKAIIMPNLEEPIFTAKQAAKYKEEILAATEPHQFEPLMTLYLGKNTTKEIVAEASEQGILASKFYPHGATTNSSYGVSNIKDLSSIFKTMQELNMVLCVHGEAPEEFILDREQKFLHNIKWLHKEFPDLKIVLEHITTKDAVETVLELGPNIAATITVHHLFITLNDVVGGLINPHLFCKPIAKLPKDLVALKSAALSGNSKFFLGTDSAPHPKGAKECAGGCAGVFSASVAIEAMADFFDKENKLDLLEGFVSTNGAQFYGIDSCTERLSLEKSDWTVPNEIKGIVPFLSGETIPWKVSNP